MQQHETTEETPWFESGTRAPDGDADLRPVRSETRQPAREPDPGDERPKPPAPSDQKVRRMFRDALETIASSKVDRKSANEQIMAAITDMESQGIPRDVTKLIEKIQSWDEPKRAAFDMAYQSARAYADLPLQGDMFRGG